MDPAQTRIEFALSATAHTVHGAFKLKEGSIRFDPAGGAAGGSIVVDAASGQTGNAGRDHKMHEKILESQLYSDITFAPARIDGQVAAQGSSQIQVRGMFGLHGAQHEITVPAAIVVTGDRLTAEVRFTVPYLKWGLKNPSTLLLRVGPTVEIDLRATGHLEALRP